MLDVAEAIHAETLPPFELVFLNDWLERGMPPREEHADGGDPLPWAEPRDIAELLDEWGTSPEALAAQEAILAQ